MAEIVYMPWKQIVVHEISEMEVGDFLQMVVAQIEAAKLPGDPVVDWAEGVMFARGEFPDTPETIHDKLRGILHYGVVNFARTSFQEQKKTRFGDRERIIRLRKVEKNADLVNLCKFLDGFKGRPVSAKLTKQSA